MPRLEKAEQIKDNAGSDKPYLVWVSFTYCTIIGILGIISFALAANKLPNHSTELPLWKYYVLLAPLLVRALTGIALFLQKSISVPLSMAMVLLAVTLPISTTILLGWPSYDIAISYRFLPPLAFVDWALLSGVAFYTVILKRSGKLK